jgi:prepilin-type processing-associated H-X9-DG protein
MEAPDGTRGPSSFRYLLEILAGLVVVFLAALLFLPAVTSGPVPNRTICKNNLKQLALALHNYHDFYGCFPPAYIADKNGRPMHSWRTLILPFVEFKPIYNEYHFDEPWNGPHNRELAALKLNLFQCPETKHADSETNYLVVVGPKTVFPGSQCVRISEITGGTTQTILLVEVEHSGIQWSEPRDLSYAEAIRGINPKDGIGISSHHKGDGAQITFADGSVRFLSSNFPADNLPALLDREAEKKPPIPPN